MFLREECRGSLRLRKILMLFHEPFWINSSDSLLHECLQFYSIIFFSGKMISSVSKLNASEIPDSLWSIWISEKLEEEFNIHLSDPFPLPLLLPEDLLPYWLSMNCHFRGYCGLEQNHVAFHRISFFGGGILGGDCYGNCCLSLFCFWYTFLAK